MRSRLVAGPCPGLDCCRAGARKCRTRSGDGAGTRIRRAGDSRFGIALAVAVLRGRARGPKRSALPLITDYFDGTSRRSTGTRLAALVLTLGVILFGVVTAIALLRTRARAARRARGAAGRDQRAARGARPRQRAAAFRAAGHRGVAGRHRRAGDHRRRLDRDPHAAAAPRARVRDLARARQGAGDRGRGRCAAPAKASSFSQTLTTLQHRHVAVEGRAIGGRAVLRIKDLTGAKSELAELAADHQQLRRDIDTVGRLLEALPSPVWARDATGAAHLGERRLCARRRGARRRRRGRAQSRNSRSGRARGRDARARDAATSTRRGCR